MLELAGPVVDVKLVFDPVTNRAKGFGFCQFPDSNIAASAIKNLNDSLVDGRNIKIGYADRKKVSRYLNTDGTTLGNVPGEAVSKSIGIAQVNRLVEELDPEERMDLVAQFRTYASGGNSMKAKDELLKNPGLAWALLRSLEMEDMVDDEEVARIRGRASDYTMVSGSVRPPPPSSSSSSSMPMSTGIAGKRPPPPPPPPLPSYPTLPSAPAHGYVSLNSPSTGYHSITGSNPAIPSLPPPRPVPAAEPASSDMDNTEVLKQLLSLTDDQLAQLPEDHRQQIIELKKQLQSGI
ncbi:Cleavage stimulation factor subunit 2 [Coemansia sp. RSA 486]|nr:Cleavage stimulation factor subunit 2 [Coemansia sp. RSA 486]KAJ2228894.1 Cleavage stimulation factor subunit 2 [Coemansia sp. RSA 485]